MMSYMSWLRRSLIWAVLIAISLGFGGLEARADIQGGSANSATVSREIDRTAQVLIAYSVDYEMDKARVEKTVDHYGEPVRDVAEQALKNNENNPNRKETAENSYERESFWNKILPRRHSLGQAFSEEDFAGMRKTSDPGEGLRE